MSAQIGGSVSAVLLEDSRAVGTENDNLSTYLWVGHQTERALLPLWVSFADV